MRGKSMEVEVSDVKEVKLKGSHIQYPNIPEKYELILNIRYGKGLLEYQKGPRTHKIFINGFYLLSTEYAKVTLQSKGGSKKYVELTGKVKGVRHHLSTPIKITMELSPKDFWEIDNLLEGHGIEISCTIAGYGFVYEDFIERRDRDELGENELFSQLHQLVPISFRSEGYSIPHEDFVKNVLEHVDRFKREYIEIPLPTTELLDKASPDLKSIAEFIKGRLEELKNVQRDLSSAKNSRDYAKVIVGTRTAIDVKGILEQSEDILAEKLYCETGIFSGEGAQDESKKQIKELLAIFSKLFSLASGFGVHPTTKDKKKKSLIANPYRSDANYLLLMAILTLGYITERLRKSIETT